MSVAKLNRRRRPWTRRVVHLGVLLTTLASLSVASPALAEWKRAESARFIVYSDGSERDLREYVRKLETYDAFLRQLFAVPDETLGRKLPVYLVEGPQALSRIHPDAGRNVAGFYRPSGEDIFAVALRHLGDDILLHEYFHHFSYQTQAAVGYPAWLIEGLAEYFMTAEIEGDLVKVGNFNSGRVSALSNRTWIPIDVLVTRTQNEVRNGQQRDTYYPVAWLLTHWFQSDTTRRAQLDAYIAAVRTGTPSDQALQTATGLNAEGLRRELRSYLNTSLKVVGGEVRSAPGDIVVTRLPQSADDLLLPGQSLKGDISPDLRASTLESIRRAAARHPDDLFALRVLAHAEYKLGDPAVAETILTRVLERDPENIDALLLMARRRTAQAKDAPEQEVDLLGRARAYLARAYAADPTHYYTLYMLAQSRVKAPGYPNDNDLATWVEAFHQAPQMPAIRLGLSEAAMLRGEFDLAITLLEPLANAAHGRGAAEAAQRLLERARAGQRPDEAGQGGQPVGEAAPGSPAA
ncbi:tetratricopeptide repeat protein [Brevundimonas variabilis]|uniref:Tetratricopeptide (TPR) repeat protein n=1 Tax=Brevundimonas variabilis TaxID=74312 RepID=A0A7W9FCU8_9CAUL|nr:tetratricopeptide repeat protein [Brevundimonas variabilis]MBB5744582.1 tetratricopeptide (TPR) repeat protein [Brevundimonas variabilis]